MNKKQNNGDRSQLEGAVEDNLSNDIPESEDECKYLKVLKHEGIMNNVITNVKILDTKSKMRLRYRRLNRERDLGEILKSIKIGPSDIRSYDFVREQILAGNIILVTSVRTRANIMTRQAQNAKDQSKLPKVITYKEFFNNQSKYMMVSNDVEIVFYVDEGVELIEMFNTISLIAQTNRSIVLIVGGRSHIVRDNELNVRVKHCNVYNL